MQPPARPPALQDRTRAAHRGKKTFLFQLSVRSGDSGDRDLEIFGRIPERIEILSFSAAMSERQFSKDFDEMSIRQFAAPRRRGTPQGR